MKKSKPKKPEPVVINGIKYYTLRDFATLTDKHTSYISLLFNDGNKERKLRGIKIGNKPLILASELSEYPFKTRGEHTQTDTRIHNTEAPQ